jgi:hypothetical protein
VKWLAQKDVTSFRSSPHSEGEWDRWFAWYPVRMATSKFSAHWVWLQFVERKWSTSIYGTERKKRRYRLPKSSKPDVRQRLHNLKKLTEKLDGALSQSRLSDKLQ